jgi:hypothetical protein
MQSAAMTCHGDAQKTCFFQHALIRSSFPATRSARKGVRGGCGAICDERLAVGCEVGETMIDILRVGGDGCGNLFRGL